MKTDLEVQEFAKSLENWVSQAQGKEKRTTAAGKMIQAFRSDSETLSLNDDLYLKSIPNTIGNLTSLKTLYLRYNQLTTLPESLGNLTNLTSLQISNNQLTTLPESLGNLTNLRELTLDNNQLTTLPESLGNFTNLTHLFLDHNQLTTLPESLGNLTNLMHLLLNNNQLTTLPESLKNITDLTYLNLSINQLTTEEVSRLEEFSRKYGAHLYTGGQTQPTNSLANNSNNSSSKLPIPRPAPPSDHNSKSPTELDEHKAQEKEQQKKASSTPQFQAKTQYILQENANKLQTEELAIMSELLKEIPKLKERVFRSSSSSTTLRNRIVVAEAEIARISEKYKSSPEDVEERSHISSNKDLMDYYQRAEKGFNEAFTAAAMLSTNEFRHQSSLSVRTLEGISNILAPLPFASLIISGTAATTDGVLSSKRLGQFNNISDLNPTSNTVDGAIFAEKLARRLTISNEGEIKNVAKGNERQDRLKGIRGFLSQAQEKVVASAKKQIGKLDDATARGLLGEDLSPTQLLALDNSKAALHHVMNQNPEQIAQTKSKIRNGKQEEIIDIIVKNAIGKKALKLVPPIPAPSAVSSIGIVQTTTSAAVGLPSNNEDLLKTIKEMQESLAKSQIESRAESKALIERMEKSEAESKVLREEAEKSEAAFRKQNVKIERLEKEKKDSRSAEDTDISIDTGNQAMMQSQKQKKVQTGLNSNLSEEQTRDNKERQLANLDKAVDLLTQASMENAENLKTLKEDLENPSTSINQAQADGVNSKDGCCVIS